MYDFILRDLRRCDCGVTCELTGFRGVRQIYDDKRQETPRYGGYAGLGAESGILKRDLATIHICMRDAISGFHRAVDLNVELRPETQFINLNIPTRYR